MANFVLDVGRQADGTAAVVAYRCVGFGTDQNHVDLTPTADGLVLGVAMESVDAAKVAKSAVFDVRVMGVAPIALGTGGAVPGNRLATAADGKVIVSATAAAGQVGIALQTGSAGTIIDVLLTPGVKIGA
jgi:hypothetical protein